MKLLKPRSKKTFLRTLKELKLTTKVKSIIADIGVEMDQIACERVKELREDVLATLLLVEKELKEHDLEYQHLTSPEVKDAVGRVIKKLKSTK